MIVQLCFTINRVLVYCQVGPEEIEWDAPKEEYIVRGKDILEDIPEYIQNKLKNKTA